MADAIIATINMPDVPEQIFDFGVMLYGILFVKMSGNCGSRATHNQLLAALKGRHELHARYVAMIEVLCAFWLRVHTCACAGL